MKRVIYLSLLAALLSCNSESEQVRQNCSHRDVFGDVEPCLVSANSEVDEDNDGVRDDLEIEINRMTERYGKIMNFAFKAMVRYQNLAIIEVDEEKSSQYIAKSIVASACIGSRMAKLTDIDQKFVTEFSKKITNMLVGENTKRKKRLESVLNSRYEVSYNGKNVCFDLLGVEDEN